MLCTDINGTDPLGGVPLDTAKVAFLVKGFLAKHSKDAHDHFKLELVKLKQ